MSTDGNYNLRSKAKNTVSDESETPGSVCQNIEESSAGNMSDERLNAILDGLAGLRTSVSELQNSTTESQNEIQRLRNQIETLSGAATPIDAMGRISTTNEQQEEPSFPTVSQQNIPVIGVSPAEVPALTVKLYDLPTFSGNAEEWPLFFANFKDTADAFRYNNRQNLMRLQKCLVGQAKEAVSSMLIFPNDVPKAIEELEFRFGRPDLIVRSQLTKIQQLPIINERNLESIVVFSTKVRNIVAFISSAGCQQHLSNTMLLEQLVSKLPMNKQFDWAKHAISIKPFPTLLEFSTWLSELAKVISLMPPTPGISRAVLTPAAQAHSRGQAPPQPLRRVLHIKESGQQKNLKCFYCEEGHTIMNCKKYHETLEVPARWDLVKSLQLCFSCLRKGHNTANCRNKEICGINDCRRHHHPSLHEPRNDTPPQPSTVHQATQPAAQSLLNCRKVGTIDKQLFKVLPVTVFGPNGKLSIYAMFDEGSSISIIDADVATRLGIKGYSQPLTLQWYDEKTVTENSSKVNLEIEGGNERNKFMLKNIFTVSNLNLPRQSFEKANFKHLEIVPMSDYANVKPAILLGLDQVHLGTSSSVVEATLGGPIAAKTKLGWVVYGPTHTNLSQGPVVLHIRQKPQDELHQMVKEYFSSENFGINTSPTVLESDDDKEARRIMETTIQHNGHRFEIGLLWKSYPPTMPNSLNMAEKRLLGIERKMAANPEFAKRYCQGMQKYFDMGYARKLFNNELRQNNTVVWYLPHFAVQSPHKPEKLRIVFDAAATVDGTSLNTLLFKGPEQAKPLMGILFKFRQGAVGVAADIREMFSQVQIRPADQHAQRFLWRNGNIDEPIQHCAMVSMIFGAVCSPCCAEFIKNRNAEDFREKYPDAVDAIVDKHYVDDFVCSFRNENEALRICQEIVQINAEAGFELRNFISSHVNIQNMMNRNAETISMSVNLDQSTAEKVLGMYWETATDTFRFHTKFHRIPPQVLQGARPPTKRELLGIVMAVFDPYGFLADFVVYSKVLIQDAWKCKLEWDEQIPPEINKKWKAWWNEFQEIKEFKINRCYSPHLFDASQIEMHIFVDASQVAFAAVGYFRIIHKNGTDVAFIAGKSRCAPQKLMSIPRLELQAAVLGVRLAKVIQNSHHVNIERIIFWSDSRTVLHWIYSSKRKYKAFVGHRIAEILRISEQTQWRWVPTSQNAADVATRPNFPPKYDVGSRWITGPDFLANGEEQWPNSQIGQPPEVLEEEVKPCQVIKIQASNCFIDFNRFSSYLKLKRTTAWILRASKIMRSALHKNAKLSSARGVLTATEVNEGEKLLIRMVQREAFPEEVESLGAESRISKKSKIFSLSPYIDEDGLMRVYGRIDEALYLPLDARRPILMPKKHSMSELIMRHFHEKHHHQNHAIVINEVRQKFWILDAKSLLKSIQRNCPTCKIDRANPSPPLMGQLPSDRVTPYVRPFTYTGVDLFGPFHVTIGRRKEKRWAVIFTCLTIRAAHLELAENLSTDAFIICLRNFINRRGTPLRIRSDNGTNFIGAQKELKENERLLDVNRITDEATNKGIDWIFNCPLNPSSGGCWERLIRIVKNLLRKTLREVAPRVETLQSVLIEAENIINSRPLTDVPLSSEEDEPITPNHFLIGCTNSTQTPHPVDEKICLKKQWRICQNLKDRLWKRWMTEYLPQLLCRTKWQEKVPPLKVNNLVLICDSNQPRSHWQKGRITQVFTTKDGQVRFAEVRTPNGIFRRPATKLATLSINGESQSDSRGEEC